MKKIDSWQGVVEIVCPRIVFSIGNFDGLHLGHRAVLASARELAVAERACLSVLTFSSNTRQVLFPEAPVEQLMEPEDRERGIASEGADFFAAIPFTPELSQLEAEAFLRQLVRDREWTAVVVGDDFAFGRDRRGNVATLSSFFATVRGTALIIPQYEIEGERVSSSLIREQLLGGRVEAAARLLGRPYGIRGVREKGNAIGRTIGYPTINLSSLRTMLPADGVYATTCSIDGQTPRPAMTYIGTRPTLDGRRRVVETNILHAATDVPSGTGVRIEFLRHLRGDRKFADLAELSAQLRHDEADADRFFAAL